MTRRLHLLALSLALIAAACTSVARQESLDAKKERWKTMEVQVGSDRLLWQLSLLSVRNLGYPLAAGSDLGSRQIESGWRTDMQPFRGEGERKRAIVRMSPVEKGLWKVEARVKVEHNQNLVSPLDPVRAQWKAAPDDEAGAQILLQHIQARLQPELEIQEPDPTPVPIR